MKRSQTITRSTQRGFTLVEMIVAVGLFAVVMLVSISALLSLVDANRKAQAIQSVMNNLNIAVDGMVRSIREGGSYRCGQASPSNPDCPSGSTIFYFQPICSGSCPDWIYDFHDGRLWRSVDGIISHESALTAPEVVIQHVNFFVIGACPGNIRAGYSCTPDTLQPKVVISIQGSAVVPKIKEQANFDIQSTAVQRVLDI